VATPAVSNFQWLIASNRCWRTPLGGSGADQFALELGQAAKDREHQPTVVLSAAKLRLKTIADMRNPSIKLIPRQGEYPPQGTA
jgi:hypothetical protein